MAKHLNYRYGLSGRKRRRGSLGKTWSQFTLTVGRIVLGLAARRGFGYTLWAWTSPRGDFRAWEGCQCYQEMEMKKKVRKDATAPGVKHVAPLESELFVKLHALAAHCAVTQYDDGDPRKPGWFTVRTLGAAWQIELKDPDTCQRMLVTQATLDDALLLATLLLDSEDAPWEPDPWMTQMKARSAKKK